MRRFLKLNRKIKILGIVLLLPIVFIFARLGCLGQKTYELSKKIYPTQILILDNEAQVVPLSLNYKIHDLSENGRTGKLNDQCFSGDKITISFNAGLDCNALIIGVDKKGIYPIFGDHFKAQSIVKNETYTVNTFVLDTTTGNEVYYLIASNGNIDFKKDVKPEIRRIQNLTSKGPILSGYNLNLNRKLFYKYINFNHLSKN